MLRGSFWPRNCVSKPEGEGAGVFLEVTRFPGLGLESGPAWSTGNLQGGRGGERGRLVWPGLAGAPEETFLPESAASGPWAGAAGL